MVGALILMGSGTQVGCVAIPTSVVTSVEQRVLFQPTQELDYSQVPTNLDYRDVAIESPGKPTLHAWYCPVEQPRAVVLFAHGNAGNVADRASLLATWTHSLNVSVLAFDYQGYGQSEGSPSAEGIIDDTRRARNWLAAETGIAPEQVVLFGQSLGGAVMIELAASDGARGLIVESTFTSVPDLAEWKVPHSGVGKKVRTQLRSIDRIKSYQGPVLISHGTKDATIPESHGRSLFEAANEPKQFVSISKAGHNWEPPFHYLLSVSRFVDRLE